MEQGMWILIYFSYTQKIMINLKENLLKEIREFNKRFNSKITFMLLQVNSINLKLMQV